MKTHYGIEFCTGVHSQNILEFSFIEKSLSEGMKIIENFQDID